MEFIYVVHFKTKCFHIFSNLIFCSFTFSYNIRLYKNSTKFMFAIISKSNHVIGDIAKEQGISPIQWEGPVWIKVAQNRETRKKEQERK